MKVLAERRETKSGKGSRTALTAMALVEGPDAVAIALEATRLAQALPENKSKSVISVKVVVLDDLPRYTSLDEYKQEVVVKQEKDAADVEYVKVQMGLHKLTPADRRQFNLPDPDPNFDPSKHRKSRKTAEQAEKTEQTEG